MNIIEAIILGSVQGIAEWLPISSEAMVILTATEFLSIPAAQALSLALSLHLGTMLAAVVYFRHDIKEIIKNVRSETQIPWFYVTTTFISVMIAGVGYLLMSQLTDTLLAGRAFTTLIGVALLVTAFLLQIDESSVRTEKSVNQKDALWLGLVQGLAIFPGISRSGSTLAVALWRNFSKEAALKVIFMISIPLIAIGSAALFVSGDFIAIGATPSLVAFATSFVVGLLTIGALLRLAKKINFSWFVGVLAVLVIASSLLQ